MNDIFVTVTVISGGRVTRTLFALAERTKMDPAFSGETLTYTEMASQVSRRSLGIVST